MGNKDINKKPIIITIIVLLLTISAVMINITTIKDRKFKNNIWLGWRYLEDKEYEKSIAEYKKALETDPLSLDARIGISKDYIAMKNFLEAENILLQGESTLRGNIEYYDAITQLFASENKVDEAYKLLNEKYEENKDLRVKNIFYKYFNITLISDKYYFKIGDKVKFSVFALNRDGNIIKPIALNINFDETSLGDIEKVSGGVLLTVKTDGVANIRCQQGFVDEKVKIMAFEDIDIIEKNNTYKLNEEMSFDIVGKGKDGETITLDKLNNKYILNAKGTIDNFSESPLQVTEGNDSKDTMVKEPLDEKKPFELKYKLIKLGAISFQVNYNGLKKDFYKYR